MKKLNLNRALTYKTLKTEEYHYFTKVFPTKEKVKPHSINGEGQFEEDTEDFNSAVAVSRLIETFLKSETNPEGRKSFDIDLFR